MSFRAHSIVLNETSLEDARRRIVSIAEELRGRELAKVPHLSRIEIIIPACNILSILRNSQVDEKFYWSDRNRRQEWMGLGVALKIAEARGQLPRAHEKMREVLEAVGGNLQFFGGMRFDQSRLTDDDSWLQFPDICFVLPLIEIRSSETQTSIYVNIFHESADNFERMAAILGQLKSPGQNDWNSQFGSILDEGHAVSVEQWDKKVATALSLLSTSNLEKIVLANAHDMWFDTPVDPVQLLILLNEKSPSTYRFLMQLSPDAAFVGASPEQLFARDELRVESEAQAGTRKRGRNDLEDQALAAELLGSQKEFVEHDLVFQDVERVLSNLCRDSGWIDQRKVIKLSHVQHLRSRFGGILKEGVLDVDIIQALHPTPAVCGRPVALALDEIRNIESFDRGYYCGPIGLIGLNKTELAVSLRSALIRGNHVRIFAGAGLVKGSNAVDEWNEIESKMRLYYELLGR